MYAPVTCQLTQITLQSNEDHCSACRSLGSLVYCDGCPRAYHLWCLNPPMEEKDLPAGDARWFCPSCSQQQVRLHDSSLSSLISNWPHRNPRGKPRMASNSWLLWSNRWIPYYLLNMRYHPMSGHFSKMVRGPPSVFVRLLTEWRRTVTTGPKGNYVDSSELKPPRLKYVISPICFPPTHVVLVDMGSWKNGSLIGYEIATANLSYVTDAVHRLFLPTSQQPLQQPSEHGERQVPQVVMLNKDEA